MKNHLYFVYIMTNQNHTVLYTGVTNNLERRVIEHRSGRGGLFTNRYKLFKLVYYEEGGNVETAIFREKQIKAGSRKNKVELINSINPSWDDLFDKFFGSS